MDPAIKQYQDYEEKMKRAALFKELKRFPIKKALYPGSYIHISPSFYFPEVVYVDNDRKAKRFFTHQSIFAFIEENRTYSEKSIVRFHGQDYLEEISEEKNSFDLLISQYAGFISQHCKHYLRPQGYLLANNSHGDAGAGSTSRKLLPCLITLTPPTPIQDGDGKKP